jgi:hypothetical protein
VLGSVGAMLMKGMDDGLLVALSLRRNRTDSGPIDVEADVCYRSQLFSKRIPDQVGIILELEGSLQRKRGILSNPNALMLDGQDTRVPVPRFPSHQTCWLCIRELVSSPHFIAVSSLNFRIFILSCSRSSRFFPFSCTSMILFPRCCLFLKSCSLLDCRSAICCSLLNSPVSCFFCWSWIVQWAAS